MLPGVCPAEQGVIQLVLPSRDHPNLWHRGRPGRLCHCAAGIWLEGCAWPGPVPATQMDGNSSAGHGADPGELQTVLLRAD